MYEKDDGETSIENREDMVSILAKQSAQIMNISFEMHSIRTLMTSYKDRDEVHVLERKLSVWKTISWVLIGTSILLFLLAV